MKTSQLLSVIALSLLSTVSSALTSQPRHQPPALSQSASASLVLYSKPQANSHVINAKLSLSEPLVIILYNQDKTWVKLASKRTGQTGWVQKKNYLSAVREARKPVFQAVIVSRENINGKRVETVVAYRQGKRLTQAQADQLYQKIQRRHQQQSQRRQQTRIRMQNFGRRFSEQQRQENNLLPFNQQAGRPPRGRQPRQFAQSDTSQELFDLSQPVDFD